MILVGNWNIQHIDRIYVSKDNRTNYRWNLYWTLWSIHNEQDNFDPFWTSRWTSFLWIWNSISSGDNFFDYLETMLIVVFTSFSSWNWMKYIHFLFRIEFNHRCFLNLFYSFFTLILLISIINSSQFVIVNDSINGIEGHDCYDNTLIIPNYFRSVAYGSFRNLRCLEFDASEAVNLTYLGSGSFSHTIIP
jgi:hypothetical protein